MAESYIYKKQTWWVCSWTFLVQLLVLISAPSPHPAFPLRISQYNLDVSEDFPFKDLSRMKVMSRSVGPERHADHVRLKHPDYKAEQKEMSGGEEGHRFGLCCIQCPVKCRTSPLCAGARRWSCAVEVFLLFFHWSSCTPSCQCSAWCFVNIPVTRLCILSDPPIFFIPTGSEDQTSFFDAQRVFCLSWLSLDVICMDRDWIINAPKPTLSPYCNLCKSHHLSDEFSKRGVSPEPNSSVAQLGISPSEIAVLIWQPDFDLQHYTEAHVL